MNKIGEPTHQLSSTLDLIIHNADSNIVPSTKVGRLFSDQYIVFFRVAYQSVAKHPGLKHTESTLTLIILLSAVTSTKT